jgi:tripartite-type tricarboxylate transporter receptor subunit TctC
MRSRVCVAFAICLIAVPAAAADYFAGKTIDFLIGGDVGGGYDIYARVLSRHLPASSRAILRSFRRTSPAPAAAAPPRSSTA